MMAWAYLFLPVAVCPVALVLQPRRQHSSLPQKTAVKKPGKVGSQGKPGRKRKGQVGQLTVEAEVSTTFTHCGATVDKLSNYHCRLLDRDRDLQQKQNMAGWLLLASQLVLHLHTTCHFILKG